MNLLDLRLRASAMLVALLAACSSSSMPPTDAGCVPGQSRVCTCDGGASGASMCGASGVYGACLCGAGTDAATDGVDAVSDRIDAQSDAQGDGIADATFDVSHDHDAGGTDAPADVSMDACARTMCGSACVDTSTDVHHCGGCAIDCTALAGVAPSAVQCVAGACSLAGACASGFANCNGVASDGCETSLGSATNCGACGTTCTEPTPMCTLMAAADGGSANYACSSGCAGMTPTRCNAMCVDTATDAQNCGACGFACAAPTNATPTCAASICDWVCAPGFASCDGDPTNGCETPTLSDANNCGACGAICAPPPGGTAQCLAGTCVVTCGPGQHLCGTACMSNTDTASCGFACVPCDASAPNVAGATCDGTSCGIACAARFADCDGNTANGCESDLTSAATCGSCATACSPGTMCSTSGGTPSCVPIPAPRLIAPLSTATVTSQQPTLHWSLAPGTDGASVDICRDRACATIVATFAAAGSSGAPATPLAAGVYFWRARGSVSGAVGTATSFTWEFFVGARTATVDSSWGTTLDVNGDGFADVLTTGYPQPTIYLGSASGIAASPSTMLTPPNIALDYLAAWSSAGDVNGDGFDDVIISDPCAPVSGTMCTTGAAFVYLGSASGLANGPATTLYGPGGYWPRFGNAVSSAGDVNGDGYADILVGAYGVNNMAGIVYVYLGSSSGISTSPLTILSGAGFGYEYFGIGLGSAGDVNGDGFGDVMIGAPNGPNGVPGTLYFYLGHAGGTTNSPDAVINGPSASSWFGQSLALAGDVNGDGYADIVVGAEGAGTAFVYTGGAGGLSTAAQAVLAGPSGQSFGESVSGGGDFNGDGFDDVIVGDRMNNSETGAMFVFEGGASGVATSATAVITGPDGTYGDFGEGLAVLGDVNADGFDDVGCVAPCAPAIPPMNPPFDMAMCGRGRLGIYLGGPSGLGSSASPDLAPQSGSYFGSMLASRALPASFDPPRVRPSGSLRNAPMLTCAVPRPTRRR